MSTRASTTRSGFTLLEMLLVVFILGIVASSMVLFLDERGDQARYDDTKRRYEQLREAMLGPEGLTLNGSPLVRGYVADTGELPGELRHLWVCPKHLRIDTSDPASPPKLFARVGGGSATPASPLNQIQLFHGWRGPYVSFASATVTGSDVTAANDDFQDAWGAPWAFIPFLRSTDPGGAKTLTLQSLGRDRSAGETPSEQLSADFPPIVMAEFATTVFDPPDAAIPGVRIARAGSTLLTLGVAYAGFDMSEAFSDTHLSIVQKSGGGKVQVGEPDNASNDGDLVDTNNSPGGDSLPPGLAFKRNFPSTERPRFPRQYQLVLYDESKSGTSFADKLVAVYPTVFTLLPKTVFVAPATPPWQVD